MLHLFFLSSAFAARGETTDELRCHRPWRLPEFAAEVVDLRVDRTAS